MEALSDPPMQLDGLLQQAQMPKVEAHLARLRLQRMKGELVDRLQATALVFRLARAERDGWINWPVRVAALMAAEIGVEAHQMQKVLEAHVRSHLADLAEVQPEFR